MDDESFGLRGSWLYFLNHKSLLNEVASSSVHLCCPQKAMKVL